MTIIDCCPERVCAVMNDCRKRYNLQTEDMRALMNRKTHQIITEALQEYIRGDVHEFMKIGGVKIVFDDDIPIGKCEIFINTSGMRKEEK